MNDPIEQEIQAKGLTAPRITPADIEAEIASEHYFTAAQGVLGAIPIATLADRFMGCPVPTTCCPDGKDGDPQRVGTNLPSVPEAEQMLGQIIRADTPISLDLLTFCVLVCKNGFTVVGESACASPENFDAEIGRKIARQKAVEKLWPLLGFRLRDALHEIATSPADPPA